VYAFFDAAEKSQSQSHEEIQAMREAGCDDKWGYVCYEDIGKFTYLSQVMIVRL